MNTTPLFPSRFIRAGAGAGKTSTLIKTFFEFVEHYKEQHRKLPRIIITTFTRKATQEVKERLLLKALSLDEDLFQYINKKSMVHISTIHGVLSLLLSKNHDLLGLTSDLKVSDQKSLYKVYYRELKFIFRSNPAYLELLEHYNFKDLVQLMVRFHDYASEYDLKYVDDGILLSLRKNKIKKAIEDLQLILTVQNQVQDHKGWKGYFDFIQDFYSQIKAPTIDFKQLFEIYENRPRKAPFSVDKPLFDSSIHDLIVDYFSDGEFVESLDSDEFIQTHEVMHRLFHQLALDFHQRIVNLKLRTGQISISDLETLSLKLIQQHPQAVKVFADQYDYFMVDEYQDTSPLQVKILTALIQDKPQFTVGDPQQSIYLFRGARSEVFLNKQALAQAQQHEILSLQTNYRSEHRLMNGLNAITQNFSNQFSPMRPQPIQEIDSTNESQIYYIKASDEFAGLVNHIIYLVSTGVSFGEICILFSKNSDIFDFTKYALRHNIPVQSLIAAGFDQKREIIDLVAFLRFLVNPYDNLNLHILLRSPWVNISDPEILQLRQSSSHALWTQLKQAQQNIYSVLNQYLVDFENQGVLATLEKFILESQFLKSSLYLDSTGKREANIYKFIANLKENLQSDQFMLNDYLSAQFSSFQEDLSSNLNESLALFSGNRVSVMTIHGAKGLQFPHVLLPGMCSKPKMTNQLKFQLDAESSYYSLPVMNVEQKLTWSMWGRQQKQVLNQKEYLEFERLFYVAITRAEKTISFIAESSKKPASQSWCTKMQWPSVGHHQFDNYAVQSLEYGSDITMEFASTITSIPHKEKLQLSPAITTNLNDQKVSVTELISQDEGVDLKTTFAPIEKLKNEKLIDHLDKAQKGTDLHRLFESLKFLPEQEVISKATASERKALKWMQDLKEVPFQQILDHGHAEWGFGLQTQLGIIQGQIDLWAQLGSQVFILDYKTGSSIYSEKAFSQLHRYAECLKKMHFMEKVDLVKLVVLYPFEEKVVVRDLTPNRIASI